MQQTSLGRWVDELAASIESLEKRVDKIVAGGGYDPSDYVYATPFLDIANSNIVPIINQEGTYTYTATGSQAIVLEIATRTELCYVMLQDNDSVTATSIKVSTIRTNDPSSVVCGPYYMEAGQVLKVDTTGTITGSIMTVIPVKTAQLQERPSLIQRAGKAIKKMLGGEK